MSRALTASRAVPTALLVFCGAALAPRVSAPLIAAEPVVLRHEHYYELAKLAFFSRHPEDGITRAEEIAAKIGNSICKVKGELYEVLIQKDDPDLEIINVKANVKSSTDSDLILHMRWGQENLDLDDIPCNNTPPETCLVLYRRQIATDVLRHDCNVHKGAQSCIALGH